MPGVAEKSEESKDCSVVPANDAEGRGGWEAGEDTATPASRGLPSLPGARRTIECFSSGEGSPSAEHLGAAFDGGHLVVVAGLDAAARFHLQESDCSQVGRRRQEVSQERAHARGDPCAPQKHTSRHTWTAGHPHPVTAGFAAAVASGAAAAAAPPVSRMASSCTSYGFRGSRPAAQGRGVDGGCRVDGQRRLPVLQRFLWALCEGAWTAHRRQGAPGCARRRACTAAPGGGAHVRASRWAFAGQREREGAVI